MNTSFFGNFCRRFPSAAVRCWIAGAIAAARQPPARRAWSNCARTCCPAAARPRASPSPAKSSALRGIDHRAAHRLFRGAGAALRHRSRAHGAGYRHLREDARPTKPPPTCTPPRNRAGRNCSAGLTSRPVAPRPLVRMREQLMDALDHREDIAAVDDDFVHLFTSGSIAAFWSCGTSDWSDAGDRAGKDHPL